MCESGTMKFGTRLEQYIRIHNSVEAQLPPLDRAVAKKVKDGTLQVLQQNAHEVRRKHMFSTSNCVERKKRFPFLFILLSKSVFIYPMNASLMVAERKRKIRMEIR